MVQYPLVARDWPGCADSRYSGKDEAVNFEKLFRYAARGEPSGNGAARALSADMGRQYNWIDSRL